MNVVTPRKKKKLLNYQKKKKKQTAIKMRLFIPSGTPVLPHSEIKQLQTDGIVCRPVLMVTLEMMNDQPKLL